LFSLPVSFMLVRSAHRFSLRISLLLSLPTNQCERVNFPQLRTPENLIMSIWSLAEIDVGWLTGRFDCLLLQITTNTCIHYGILIVLAHENFRFRNPTLHIKHASLGCACLQCHVESRCIRCQILEDRPWNDRSVSMIKCGMHFFRISSSLWNDGWWACLHFAFCNWLG
jgi:hypothetical protein